MITMIATSNATPSSAVNAARSHHERSISTLTGGADVGADRWFPNDSALGGRRGRNALGDDTSCVATDFSSFGSGAVRADDLASGEFSCGPGSTTANGENWRSERNHSGKSSS